MDRGHSFYITGIKNNLPGERSHVFVFTKRSTQDVLMMKVNESDLIARRATLYARSASWGSRAEKRYLAKVCMGTLSLWMTSPRPLNGPAAPRERETI